MTYSILSTQMSREDLVSYMYMKGYNYEKEDCNRSV